MKVAWQFHTLGLPFLLAALLLYGCAGPQPLDPAPTFVDVEPDYVVGPGDSFNVFVWRQPELSAGVTVRPDGKITTPLIEDVPAIGKTPTQLARDMEERLSIYVRNPVVTVMGSGVGPFDQQVRVVGQATTPLALPYTVDMTVLDAMIAVGGLGEFAAGNNSIIVRRENEGQMQYSVRLDDLIYGGDITANVPLMPGDIIIIPEAWF